MTPELTKPQVAREQLSDLNKTLEKEKVKLTQEVEKYTRDHVRIVHNKLQAGEPVYESDLAFIPKVKMWVMMPKEWREKYPSVEDMEKSEELKEANKRHISIKQWWDLLQVFEVTGDEKELIDEIFEFPGAGKIERKGNLYLRYCTGLTKLPEGLKVGGSLDLWGCTGLTKLPEVLEVGGGLDLMGCTGLTELPEGLKVGGRLDLIYCTGLTELPEGLKVGMDLNLKGCTRLTELPEGLKVDGNLYLSANLNEHVKKDAERLKKEGKIEGKIIYRD